MLQAIKNLLAAARKQAERPALEFGDVTAQQDGFTVGSQGKANWSVRWTDIKEIVGFKRDIYAFDQICLGFRVSDTDDYYIVTEEMSGFGWLAGEMERQFQTMDRNWWTKVAQPPFATNWVTIYGEPWINRSPK